MRHRPFRQQVEFLVDNADAHFLRLDRVVEGYSFLLEMYRPLILFIGADHYFHQRGFTGAVLPDHRIDLSWVKLN